MKTRLKAAFFSQIAIDEAIHYIEKNRQTKHIDYFTMSFISED